MWDLSIRRSEMSRLTIDITDQQHQSLKALAALQGKTIKQYALERLFPGDTDGERAWEDLKTLMSTRVNEGLSGNVSTKTVGEILDEEIAEGRG
jgi:hypothetical protein